MNKEVLQLEHCSFAYEKEPVFSDISFSLSAGKLCALSGRNGSGKTTLLKVCCGLLSAKGSCRLFGKNVSAMSARERARSISYLSRQGSADLPMNALDVVMMGYYPELGAFQHASAAQQNHALEIMEQTGALPFAQKNFVTLSTGQRQLVLLSRALVRSTPLLLLDEPDSALDPVIRRRIYSLLAERAACSGQAVLIITHDLALALQTCHQLLVLDEHRLACHLDLPLARETDLKAALRPVYGPLDLIWHQNHWLISPKEGES